MEIPDTEKEAFADTIKSYRSRYIKKASDVVNDIFEKNDFSKLLKSEKKVSFVIEKVRELGWRAFLVEEAEFNAILLRDLHKKLETPRAILDHLISSEILNEKGENLRDKIKEVCGEYAGRISPYIYALSLSNTQSRRSRAGATFEALIYKIYEILGYPFDSQRKLGKRVFELEGLGKKVDSVLPSLEAFKQRRNKTIIGTMKTTLRERWQEVAEEIDRTNIPEIHLLTVDEEIAKNKAEEMKLHNIIIVALDRVKNNPALRDMKNIISFEDYFYDEIPQKLEFWK